MGKVSANSLVLVYLFHPLYVDLSAVQIPLHLAYFKLNFILDGPALRSTAIIAYANWLIANSNTTFVTNTLWPIIKLDLDYVSTFWNQSRYRYAHFLAYFTY